MIGKPSMSSDVSPATLSPPKAGSKTSEKRTMASVARSWCGSRQDVLLSSMSAER